MQRAPDENSARNRPPRVRTVGYAGFAHGPEACADEQPSAAPRRRVESPPAAAVVLAPVVGLLLWAGLFAIIF